MALSFCTENVVLIGSGDGGETPSGRDAIGRMVALALAGAALALTNARAARVLIAAALGGLVSVMPLEIPAGVLIGAAAVIRGQTPSATEQSTERAGTCCAQAA